MSDEFDIEPDFNFDTDTKDPLADVPIDEGDLEAASKAEVSAMLKAFKERNDREQADKTAALDSEYWFCVCFQTREQKEAFLKAMQWFEHGDKYLDGKFVAKKLGVELPPANIKYHEREEKTSYTDQIPVIRGLPPLNRKVVKSE